MGSDTQDTNLVHFKEKWGALPHPITHYTILRNRFRSALWQAGLHILTSPGGATLARCYSAFSWKRAKASSEWEISNIASIDKKFSPREYCLHPYCYSFNKIMETLRYFTWAEGVSIDSLAYFLTSASYIKLFLYSVHVAYDSGKPWSFHAISEGISNSIPCSPWKVHPRKNLALHCPVISCLKVRYFHKNHPD